MKILFGHILACSKCNILVLTQALKFFLIYTYSPLGVHPWASCVYIRQSTRVCVITITCHHHDKDTTILAIWLAYAVIVRKSLFLMQLRFLVGLLSIIQYRSFITSLLHACTRMAPHSIWQVKILVLPWKIFFPRDESWHLAWHFMTRVLAFPQHLSFPQDVDFHITSHGICTQHA